MKLSFRRPAEPPPGPSPDQIIADLSRDNARLRDEKATLLATVAYQNGRMRDMAAQILGSQSVVGRFLAATEWFLVARGVELPPMSTVDGTAVVPHECRHSTLTHGQWGCVEPGCECSIPRHMLGQAKAVVS